MIHENRASRQRLETEGEIYTVPDWSESCKYFSQVTVDNCVHS